MRAYAFLIAVGFFLTFGAVGGMETDGPLLDCLLIGLLGLGIAGCGVLMMRQEDENQYFG
jgi:hypothetical protein